jgi:hypothetical protein
MLLPMWWSFRSLIEFKYPSVIALPGAHKSVFSQAVQDFQCACLFYLPTFITGMFLPYNKSV